MCRMAFVQQLVNFHSQHLASQQQQRQRDEKQLGPQESDKTTYAAHIFALIAHQVAYTCRRTLDGRLAEVQKRHNCMKMLGPFLPPSIFKGPGGGSSDDGTKQEVEPSSLLGFLSHFKRVEHLALITNPQQRGAASEEPYFEVIVPAEVLARLEQLKQSCLALEPHYMGLFGPIVSLAQIGYETPEQLTTAALGDRQLEPGVLKCWLATAQLCQGIRRTHFAAAADEKPEAGAADEKVLVQIKFGRLPEAAQQAEMADNHVDSFDEIEPEVVELVRERRAFGRKMERMLVKWAKRVVMKHLQSEAARNEQAKRFMQALASDGEDGGESSVGLCGQKRNTGLHKPTRLVTDETDTFFQCASFLTQKVMTVVLSSVIVICMSFVFVTFSLHALVTWIRGNKLPSSSGNFKAAWRQMRDERMKVIEAKLRNENWTDKMQVYHSPSG